MEAFSQNLSKNFNAPKLSGFFQSFDHTQFPQQAEKVQPSSKKINQTKPPTLSSQAVSEEIKKRAITTFAGMIYGYSFYLVPNSLLYQVKREFELSLRGKIDASKIQMEESFPELDVPDNSKIVLPIEYLATYPTNAFEAKRRALWAQDHFLNCHAIGKISFDSENENRYNEVVELAIRNGLVSLFQEKLINKPRKIEGNLLLVGPPRLFYENQMLYAEVHFLVEEKKVIDYVEP